MKAPISLFHFILTALEFLLFVIPLKLIAANWVGRSSLADAAYSVI